MLQLSYELILASASPRRQQLLKTLDVPFRVEVKPIDETPPPAMPLEKIASFLAQKKAEVFAKTLQKNELVLTADTVVICENEFLGKPETAEEAFDMISKLSGKSHSVITGVCLRSLEKEMVFADETKVFFRKMTDSEIRYYVEQYKPYDKAGAYGAQDWIGLSAIERLEGSYFTVMGLPTHLVYEALRDF